MWVAQEAVDWRMEVDLKMMSTCSLEEMSHGTRSAGAMRQSTRLPRKPAYKPYPS